MNEKLLKGKFILCVLVEVALFAACLSQRMSGSEYGIAAVAVLTAFLHFDAKAVA